MDAQLVSIKYHAAADQRSYSLCDSLAEPINTAALAVSISVRSRRLSRQLLVSHSRRLIGHA